jgi:hypothetical protein
VGKSLKRMVRDRRVDDLDPTVLLGPRGPVQDDAPTVLLADRAAAKPTKRPALVSRWPTWRSWPSWLALDRRRASPGLIAAGSFVAGGVAVVVALLILQPWAGDAPAPTDVARPPAPPAVQQPAEVARPPAPPAVQQPAEVARPSPPPAAQQPVGVLRSAPPATAQPPSEDRLARAEDGTRSFVLPPAPRPHGQPAPVPVEPQRRTALAVPSVASPATVGEQHRGSAPPSRAQRKGGIARAERASYAEVLGNTSTALRVFRYAGNDRVLILDYPSLREQGGALNRIATLVEKTGTPRDRVMSNDELSSYISSVGRSSATLYFGHDYPASDVARFFNLTDRDAISLTAEERNLRQTLLDHGFLVWANGEYAAAAPAQALVSLVQEQADDPTTGQSELVTARLRHIILRHELSHGEFFTNEGYRDYSIRFWRTRLSDDERSTFRRFLASREYDPENEALMINEMQAFLAHTHDEGIFSAASLGVTPGALAQLRRRFLDDAPPLALFEEGPAMVSATGGGSPAKGAGEE